MNPELKWEVFYPHPPERVWQALRDPAALREWLQPAEDVIDYHVLEAVPETRIAYSWRTRDVDAVVTFELQPAGGGTTLRLRMDQRVHLSLEWLRACLDRAVEDTAGHVLVFSSC